MVNVDRENRGNHRESVPELFTAELPNYADQPTGGWPGEFLVKMAAQANAQVEVEAATQE